MKTIFTIIFTLLFISSVGFAQDTLYIYKGGAVVNMRALADIDSITFYKSGSTVTDFEGNVYKTVKIGNRIWMAENLKTRKYNDGTAIPLVTGEAEWASSNSPGYCWYNNDSAAYNATYGILYNWYTVNAGNICPSGWHVPTDEEWHTLVLFLDPDATFTYIPNNEASYMESNIAGGKLKEAGTAHWADPNEGATNETGFTALSVGWREIDGTFLLFGKYSVWWGSSSYDTDGAWNRMMHYDSGAVSRVPYYKRYGFSIRCLRDE